MIQAISTLTTLKMGASALTDWGMKSLSTSHRLNRLSIPYLRCISNTSIQNLQTLTNLRRLNIAYAPLEFDISILSSLSQLEKVNLRGCHVTDDTIYKMVSIWSKLRTIDLSITPITDRGIAAMSSLSSLTKLSIASNNQVSDSYVDVISKLNNLQVINLTGTKLTDDGLLRLVSMPFLWQIIAEKTPTSMTLIKFLQSSSQIVIIK